MKSCEDGYGFLEIHPDSAAAGPFAAIVKQIVDATAGKGCNGGASADDGDMT